MDGRDAPRLHRLSVKFHPLYRQPCKLSFADLQISAAPHRDVRIIYTFVSKVGSACRHLLFFSKVIKKSFAVMKKSIELQMKKVWDWLGRVSRHVGIYYSKMMETLNWVMDETIQVLKEALALMNKGLEVVVMFTAIWEVISNFHNATGNWRC